MLCSDSIARLPYPLPTVTLTLQLSATCPFRGPGRPHSATLIPLRPPLSLLFRFWPETTTLSANLFNLLPLLPVRSQALAG